MLLQMQLQIQYLKHLSRNGLQDGGGVKNDHAPITPK